VVVDPDKSAPREARRSYSLNPYERQHKGFLGFRGFHVIDESPEQPPVQPPRVSTRDLNVLELDTALSYSDLESDTGIGVYEPQIADYLPEDADTSPGAAVNRDVELIAKVLPKVPFMAKENNRVGYVEVLLYVDSTGAVSPYAAAPQPLNDSSGLCLEFVMKDGRTARLRFYVDSNDAVNTCQYLVVKEDPREYGFAKNLTDVLPGWVFSPKIKDSRPVGTFVRICFHFCDQRKELDCFRLFLINS
jgi:hypothetical protein